MLNNYDKFIDNVNFKGWVLKIMRNIFINNYTSSSVHRSSSTTMWMPTTCP